MKNSFIQSFLFQNFCTTVNNDLFRNNDKVDDDHISDYIEEKKDEDINDEDSNLDKIKKYNNLEE